METHTQIPFAVDDQPSGTFEISLKPIYAHAWYRTLVQMHLPMVAFCVVAGFIVFRLYLKRTLKHLDPGSAVPDRINTLLDILSDGLVLTDKKGKIRLANDAFLKGIAQPADAILGKSLSTFKWMDPSGNAKAEVLPWHQVLEERCKNFMTNISA